LNCKKNKKASDNSSAQPKLSFPFLTDGGRAYQSLHSNDLKQRSFGENRYDSLGSEAAGQESGVADRNRPVADIRGVLSRVTWTSSHQQDWHFSTVFTNQSPII
jgi:hypothetical protein